MELILKKEVVENHDPGNNMRDVKSDFRAIYDQFRDKIYTLSYSYFHDSDTANDITQQIFIKVFKSLDMFEGKSNLSTWIYRIAMNHCIDQKRKLGKGRFVSLDTLKELSAHIVSESPEEIHFKVQISEAVKKVIMTLKPKFRDVLVLKYIDDLSYTEIAEIVGCSEGTVGSRLNTGYKLLYNQLKFLVDRK